jgi:di/tricarboxylate transporter
VDDSFFNENLNEQQFSLVSRIAGARIKRYNRAVIATVITVAMVAVVAAGVMNMLNAAMLASGAMLLTGCLTLRQAGRSVEFGTLLVIASAIGLAEAVTTSGLSDVLADLLLKIGGDNLYIALVVVFLGCIFMDTLVTNVASAAFMFPIAVNMAAQLNANFMPFAITLMVGASCSFISPMGYATNLMVYTAGEYEFSDFVKFGVPLTILVGIVTIILTPMFFKF